MNAPSLRKPLGVLLILIYIAVWVAGVLALSPWILATPWPMQALLFTIAGLAWIFPLKPLLGWMER